MQPPTVLVVDDSEPYRLFARLALARSCEVVLASSVGDALEQALRRLPDAVLTDYQMPRRTGLDLLELLGAWAPGIPVVVMSSFLPNDVAARALSLGARAAVEKPSTPEGLRDLVDAALRTEGRPLTAA